MKQLVFGKGSHTFLFISVAVLSLFLTFSLITVKRIILNGGEGYSVKELSLKTVKKTLTPLASPKISPSPAKAENTYPYSVENPPTGVKAIKNRFLASDSFPADEKTSLEDILLAVGDKACGYNKIIGLQCGGATSVFRDIKGVCWGVTPIPYDPCCGAAPQYVNDPRDKYPRCPEPTCSGFCYCAPPPAGCTPIIPFFTLHVEEETHSTCVNGQCVEVQGPGKSLCTTDADCTIEVHKECMNGQCFAVPGPGAGDPQCEGAADGAPCDGGGGDCSTDPDPEQCCAQNPGSKGCDEEDCTQATDKEACCEENPEAEGCDEPGGGSSCLPLACNCVCAARAGGGQFAWLWDSVTGFCGCNP